MLKPGGQLMFNTFEKTFMDDAYNELDNGKWRKYDNRKSISPFYWHENPFAEYESLLKSLGFVNCHFSKGVFKAQYSETAFDGESSIIIRYSSIKNYNAVFKLFTFGDYSL